MFCTNCGFKLTFEDVYCPECGTKNASMQELTQTNNLQDRNQTVNKSAVGFEQPKTINNDPINTNQRGKVVIVRTSIIGNDSRKSATSSVIRGSVGGVLLGPIGLVGGLLSGKNRNKTTFLIYYSDGSKKTLTVKTGGVLFNQLIKFMNE